MAERKPFLVRLDAGLLDGLRRWADADLRSLNGQIEYLLRKALADRGQQRLTADSASTDSDQGRGPGGG